MSKIVSPTKASNGFTVLNENQGYTKIFALSHQILVNHIRFYMSFSRFWKTNNCQV